MSAGSVAPASPAGEQSADRLHETYATSYENLLWIDGAVDALSRSGAIVLAITLYLLGLGLSLIHGFSSYYVQSLAVYIGSFGFAGILLFASYSHRRYHRTFARLRPLFTESDEAWSMRTGGWLGWLRDHRWLGGWCIALAIVNYGFIAGVLPLARHTLDLTSLRPVTVAHQWYDARYRWPAAPILVIFATAEAAALGTALHMLTTNLRVLWNLRRARVIPFPTIVRARFRALGNLFVCVSFGWTAGVALVFVLFRDRYNAFSITLMGVLAFMGIATLAIPQCFFRHHLDCIHQRMVALVLVRLYSKVDITLEENLSRADSWTDMALISDDLTSLRTLTERPKTWIYDGQDVAVWIVGQLVAGVVAYFVRNS